MTLRNWLLFLLAAAVMVACGSAFAMTVPYKFRGLNVTRDGGQTYLRGTSPAEVAAAGVNVSNHTITAAGSANWFVGMGAVLQSGGVPFNAAVPIASTAAAVAVTAVRANPAGLVTSAVASYLLGKGIEYASGEFMTTVPGSSSPLVTTYYTWGGFPASSAAGTCARYASEAFPYQTGGQTVVKCGAEYVSGSNCKVPQKYSNSATCNYLDSGPITSQGACPEGTTLQNGQCVGASTTRPSTDADWEAARVGYWPDQAILDLVKNGVPLPTDKAVFEPPYKDEAISDPYVDPVTGNRYQDKARITPQPSTPDTAEVQISKQQVDAAGNPVEQNGAPVAPEAQTDFCKTHPEASACQVLDGVDDVVIPAQSNPFSVSPVSGFGADTASCPATQHLFTKSGQSIDWSWGHVCTFAQGIRPLVIGFAWLSAIGMVVAVGRRGA